MFNYTTLDESNLDFVSVVPISELRNGERLFFDVIGRSIVIFNIADKYYAIGDVCSHDDGPVGEGDLDGLKIICPRHGAEFDVQTGKVLKMPAVVDIPAYPVRVIEGYIQIGIPKE